MGLDIPFQQLTAWPQAIATDCFLGDTAEAGRKLEAFTALVADTPQARLALGQDATARDLLYTVPAGWLRVEALLALARPEEAAKVLDGLTRDLYLSNLSTQPAGPHLLDARVAFANGDKARARRALRRFLADWQRRCIERCLVENGGNVAATSAELGISRSLLTQRVLSDAELRRLAGRDG